MTKTQQTKAVNEAVTAYYSNGVSLDTTATVMAGAGVKFSDIEATIKSVGLKLKLVLTDAEIVSKVTATLKADSKPTSFYDVVDLANKLDMPQLTQGQKQDAVQRHFSVKLKVHGKVSKLYKSEGNKNWHGKIAAWIMENPDFTPQQLLSSGVIDGCPNAEDYYHEFLAYQQFFTGVGAGE